MVDVLEAKPEIDLVYADVIKTQTPNETFDRCSPTGVLRWYDWDRQTLLDKGCFIGPQPVWRRQVHATYGYFDANYAISADYEFWLRISQKSSFFHINTPLGLYLDHPDSIEHRHRDRKLKEDMEINSIYKYAEAHAEFIGFGRDSDLPKATTVHESANMEMNTATNDVNHVEINSMKLTQGGLKMYSPENILSAIRFLANSEHKKELGWFLDNLIADFPDMAEAHKEKAEIAYEQQDMESAQKHYELAAKLAPDSFEFQKNLGDFRYAVQQDGNRALEMYAKALAIQPNNVETLILAGHVAVSLHQFDKAQQYYSHVISIAPENHEIRCFMDKLRAMTTGNASKPSSTAELLSSAQEKCGNGDHQGAISSLEEVVVREPQNALAHNDLGVLYYDQGQKDKALYHYQKAAMFMPENQVFQKNLADLYWVEYSDAQKAMERYVAALKIDPQDVESMMGCSRICMQMGKNEDADVFLKCILELEPWNEDALQLIGRLEQKSQRDQAAMTSDARDMHTQANVASADLYGRIDDLLEVIAQSPQDANALNDLGVLFYESGDKEKALDCYEQAVNLQPEQPNFVKNLADFYLMEQGRIEDALKLYVRVLENNAEDVDCLSCTGLICAIMGKNYDARHFYQRVLEIEPWNQAVREAMEKLGNDQDAVNSNFDFKIATA
jgi:tetratricopeptide (TPR) repeat protein